MPRNDKKQAEPLAPGDSGRPWPRRVLERPKHELGTTQIDSATLDNGYYSEPAVGRARDFRVRSVHRPGRRGTMVLRLKALRGPPRPKGAMAAESSDALKARHCTPDVRSSWNRWFGQSKEGRGSPLLASCLDNIRGEWRLVCLTHNVLKNWRYGCVLHAL